MATLSEVKVFSRTIFISKEFFNMYVEISNFYTTFLPENIEGPQPG